MVRSVTVSEPEFSADDLALLISSRRAERAPRGPHGVLLSEATNPDLQGEWEVPLPIQDFVEKKLKTVKDAYHKQYGDTAPAGLIWRVSRRAQSGPTPPQQ